MHPTKSHTGFTVIELLLALTVFAVGLPAFVEAGAFALRTQARAEATVLAADLAQVVLARLSVVDAQDPLLAEVYTENSKCFTVSGSCAADHGASLPELTRVLGNWGASGGSGSAFEIQMQDGYLAVWYEGYWYHVAWNVEVDEPYPGMKTIDIYVVQKPFTGSLSLTFSRVTHVTAVRMMTAS